jgi:lysophospholipase L1-like esterase
MIKTCLLPLFFCLACSSNTVDRINSKTYDILPAPALEPYGRFLINERQGLELISSGVHLGFSFEGKECRLYVSLPPGSEHNYLQYELDGVYQKRIRVNGGIKEPLMLQASTEGRHTVWLFKATEAHTGPVVIEKIEAPHIQALQTKAAPFIEFIGNSITCGAGADPSEVPCGTGQYHDQHNAYLAYGPRLARALGANFTLSSVSGIGMYRNWNSDGPTMPTVYEKMDFQDYNPKRWDFSRFTPRVVSIALGTNDFSHGDGKKERLPFDSTAFIGEYVKFIGVVKSKYPAAQVALLSSPMLQGAERQTLQNCLTRVKQQVDELYFNDKTVALFFFKPMKAQGCTGHPNIEDHALLAQELLPFFENLLK